MTKKKMSTVATRGKVKLSKRANAYSIHKHLRDSIFNGKIKPGEILAQETLAREIGVSRTPVREAIRMLQNEGLVEAKPNSRAGVREFSASNLDAVYALRIFLEPLAIALSIPRMTDAHFNVIDECFGRMVACERSNDFSQWIIEHRNFHLKLVAFCGEGLLYYINRLLEQSTRFQYLFIKLQGPTWKDIRDRDHAALAKACRDRRPTDAYKLMLTHLADSGLTVLDEFPSEQGRPPGTAINAAIAIASAGMEQLSKSRDPSAIDTFAAILGQFDARRLTQSVRDTLFDTEPS